MDQGSIEFSPAEGQETFSGAPIKDGQYLIPAEHGLAPGRYDVRIRSSEWGAPVTDSGPNDVEEFANERIPAQYNSETTLTAEVRESGENKFDFEIP